MQSGVGGGSSRNPGAGSAGRGTSTSAAASPSSSSSAVSASHLGFESLQQQQQLGPRQSLQQQLLRKPENNEAFLACQAGVQGVMRSNNFNSLPSSIQVPQQARKFLDLAQEGSSQDVQGRGQAVEQQMLTPVHHAYLHFAMQAAQQNSALARQSQQQSKLGPLGTSAVKDQGMRMGNLKMQDHVSMQVANQSQTSTPRNSSEKFALGEKQLDCEHHPVPDQKNEVKHSTQGQALGHLMPNGVSPLQASLSQQGIQQIANNQLPMPSQLQALQAWAHERNIDLSHPANANLMQQLIPLMQSRLVPQSKPNDNHTASHPSTLSVQKQQIAAPPVGGESSPHATSSSDVSGQSNFTKGRHPVIPSHLGPSANAGMVGNSNNTAAQQFTHHGRENQMTPRPPVIHGNGTSSYVPQSSSCMNPGVDLPVNMKNTSNGSEPPHVQQFRQFSQSSSIATAPNEGGSGNPIKPQGRSATQMPQQGNGFTKQQLHVLKAQILAFRRLKKGEGTLPQELLQAIVPPPLEVQLQQQNLPSGGGYTQDKYTANVGVDRTRHMESTEKNPHTAASVKGQNFLKTEAFPRDEKSPMVPHHPQATPAVTKESTHVMSAGKDEQESVVYSVKSDYETDHSINRTSTVSDPQVERGKAVASQVFGSETLPIKKPAQASTPPLPKDVGSARKYHGPLFDFPFFIKKNDSFGSAVTSNNGNNLLLAYDVKDLLLEGGMEVLNQKRTDNLKKIEGLLAVNLERKRIRPDLVVKLQIEEKKIRLLDLQTRLRNEIDQQQQEIMAMPDRPYRKFVRLCERQRLELLRQVQASQRALREKQLKSIFQWRKKLLEAHWAVRDARTARNRGVAKYHERMLREFSKQKDDDRNKRMEALKNNDVERYREMLLEQQTSIPGDAAERYAVVSSFLTQTEEYLQKLGSKITSSKNQQEAEEAAAAAAAAARLQGLSEEEVRAAAACAGEEVIIRNRFTEMNAPKDNSSVSKYYNLAHAVNEKVIRQPSMLRAGTLRDYQLVGLQWMLSLYNNKLNGILADEMGLGKTVQVMALIAYLMEFKGNYGPHLIIVPNAVLVNWKSELHNWLPSVSCIYYVGGKEQRTKLFSQEVCAMKFNVLVTTYEFIMYDRSKLSKVDWKYIIIDEAQRMKDRDSVLARDLDRYRCQRRLLLTGTPLQNDLKELWSLLNLLLPEVFDNRKAFHDWFSQPFQKEGPSQNPEDDWLETEKKVIIIHRLHQILEPFMLRRRIEDVEGSLPPKVSIVLKCRMSAIQSAIYDWIKSTGTLRLDPEDEKSRVQKNPAYQVKQYKTLNNRCMELRKTCNHPLLNYPYFNDLSKDFLVKSCGKLWILDRILIKLQRTGHRVLLFSTMTKLLDILEEYLQFRRLVYRRIDGTTSLEDRESAIVDFNDPNTDCFIFLLSIRAAGRGLNLQTADTVIIYDPDPNPKNEEQAVARAHRIGQRREVKVIYMEAVVDKISSHQKEDELRSSGTVDSEDDLAGKDRYMGSIESLIRNNIQQYKIDMADEVINAGRFDQRTTHEERRLTLETLLHDEERYQETVHDVPSLQQVNRMIARSDDEIVLFDKMDEEMDWAEEMTKYDQVPKWLRASTREVNAAVAALSKRPSKNILGGGFGIHSGEMGSDMSLKTERRRGRPKGTKNPNYKELEDENEEYSEASSEERNGYSAHEEEAEIGDFEDDGFSIAVVSQPADKDQMEDDGRLCDVGYECSHSSENARNNSVLEEARSSGSSLESIRLTTAISPSVSSQKFGSLSALDARPSSIKRTPDELEEGEIAVSGDSHMDLQQSGSWIQDRDDGEDEQVLQPKIKRKRSLRIRPRTLDRPEEKSANPISPLQHGDSSVFPLQADHKYQAHSRNDPDVKSYGEPNVKRHYQNDSLSKSRRNLPSRRVANSNRLPGSTKSTRLNSMSGPSENVGEYSKEGCDGKPENSSGPSANGTKTLDNIHRQYKNVISRFQRRIDKEGHHIVPLLTDLWKRMENSGNGHVNVLDLRKINQRIDRLEYNGVMELVFDVQFMLKNAMQFFGYSHEVRTEARKVHDLFFDILRITFPDTDFREARNALSYTSPMLVNTVSSPKQGAHGQSKKLKPITEMDREASPSHKPRQRMHHPVGENARVRGHAPQKESRLGSGGSNGSGNGREQPQLDNSPLAHPGELVVCKKKRKDREKSVVKLRIGSVGGPVSSPPNMGHSIRSPASGSVSKDTRMTAQGAHSKCWPGQQLAQPSTGSGGSVGWANPVKRLRTDSGRRRPSHQ